MTPFLKTSPETQTMEEQDMQCYRYLAAANAVAQSLESTSNSGRKIPFAVLVDWMEASGIEAEQLLQVSGPEMRAIVDEAIRCDQPDITHAA